MIQRTEENTALVNFCEERSNSQQVEECCSGMGTVLTDYLPPNPDAPDPPFLWGDPDAVRERLGGEVDDLAFESGTVLTPVLSPAHYWEAARTQSGLFIVALETVADDDRPALREEMIETIERYVDDRQNAVPMEHQLPKATVE